MPDTHTEKHQAEPPRDSGRPAIESVQVGLCVRDRDVLVVGAGRIAARKARIYATQGARITVVAPRHGPEMCAIDVAVRHHREFETNDLEGQWLAVTATGDPGVDGAVYAAAQARQIWCNAADDPEHCSVVLPATVRRGDITVAVSTGGRSPAAASWLRRRIDAMLDEDTLDVVGIATRIRDRMRASGQPTEVAGWAEILDEHALQLVATDHRCELETRLAAAVGALPEGEGVLP
jgi:siroheme synthase-like protein